MAMQLVGMSVLIDFVLNLKFKNTDSVYKKKRDI
jgi:hypothetical protein